MTEHRQDEVREDGASETARGPAAKRGSFTPQQRLLILDAWLRSQLPARTTRPRNIPATKAVNRHYGLKSRFFCRILPLSPDEPTFGPVGFQILHDKKPFSGGDLMKKFVIAAACLLLLTSAASAGAYIGASTGQSDTSMAGASGEETSWKLVGGYSFMKFFAVEGGYRSFGDLDETVGTTQIGLEASSFDVFAVGRMPVGLRFSFFAKAGYAFLDLDATVTDPMFGTITTSASETELAYGVGLSFKIIDSFHIRAEYETIDTTESLDMVSVGAVFKF